MLSGWIRVIALSCLACFSKASTSNLLICPFRIDPGEPGKRVMASIAIPKKDIQLRQSNAFFLPRDRAQAPVAPPFLRHPFLFVANSFQLRGESLRVLGASAHWLIFHPGARVLIVGTCDSSGSEVCTRTLAEARGQAINKILTAGGMHESQIAGVRVWNNLDRQCRPTRSLCQRKDRSAWIFVASSIAK